MHRLREWVCVCVKERARERGETEDDSQDEVGSDTDNIVYVSQYISLWLPGLAISGKYRHAVSTTFIRFSFF